MTERRNILRAVTWNIHGCVGRDGKRDMHRIGASIKALAPDIAAFQEVDARDKTAGYTDIHDYLREQVGDHGHTAWSISGVDGNYGQMLASRYPLTGRKVHDISVPGREPRKVMEARVMIPAQGVARVIATHLGLRRAERRQQLSRLREIVKADLAIPVLLMGDFNEWRWRGPQLGGLFKGATTHASFPARFPVFALDRIYARPASLLTQSRTAREAHLASDHLPVVAEITLPVKAQGSL